MLNQGVLEPENVVTCVDVWRHREELEVTEATLDGFLPVLLEEVVFQKLLADSDEALLVAGEQDLALVLVVVDVEFGLLDLDAESVGLANFVGGVLQEQEVVMIRLLIRFLDRMFLENIFSFRVLILIHVFCILRAHVLLFLRFKILPFLALLFHTLGIQAIPLSDIFEGLLEHIGYNGLEPLAYQQLAALDRQKMIKLSFGLLLAIFNFVLFVLPVAEAVCLEEHTNWGEDEILFLARSVFISLYVYPPSDF